MQLAASTDPPSFGLSAVLDGILVDFPKDLRDSIVRLRKNSTGFIPIENSVDPLAFRMLASGLSQAELARVTGYSLRAIAGWESGKPLSASARQKMIEAHRLREALAQIMPPNELGVWMRTPNPAFEGQTPIQVIERGESDRLWRMIVQIDANVAS